MATISNTPRPGYVWDATDNCWYPIGTGPHSHADYITSSSAINPNIVDAKGDIIAATAADTVARLAVGSNDQVLTADSSTATGLKWATPAAGGMTLLATHTLSGATSTISGISGSYNKLYGVIYGVTNATADGSFSLRCNASTTEHIQVRYTSNAVVNVSGNVFFLMANTTANVTRTDANNAWTFTIDNYANASAHKPITSYGLYNSGAAQAWAAGGYFANTAITSLVFANTGGNLSTGTVLLYGVK
jgi:hypothetical protein